MVDQFKDKFKYDVIISLCSIFHITLYVNFYKTTTMLSQLLFIEENQVLYQLCNTIIQFDYLYFFKYFVCKFKCVFKIKNITNIIQSPFL